MYLGQSFLEKLAILSKEKLHYQVVLDSRLTQVVFDILPYALGSIE